MKEKRKIMLERFVKQTTFESQEDFIKNFKVIVPENFNFGYDVVDVWADEEPNRKALCWTNDKGDHVDFTFAEIKKIFRPNSFILSIVRYWSWRYGNAHSKTSFRVLVFHYCLT